MEMNPLTDEETREGLRGIVPPVCITEEAIHIYNIAYTVGAAKAIRVCLRDVVERDARIQSQRR